MSQFNIDKLPDDVKARVLASPEGIERAVLREMIAKCESTANHLVEEVFDTWPEMGGIETANMCSLMVINATRIAEKLGAEMEKHRPSSAPPEQVDQYVQAIMAEIGTCVMVASVLTKKLGGSL